MKYLFQIMIIGGITFAGELLHAWLPLPVPASVYGMILLFLCLCLKIIKEDQIRETADFLLLIMPVLFVGPGVGIIDNYMAVSDAILPFIITVFVTTIIVMAVTGLVSQTLIRWMGGGKNHE